MAEMIGRIITASTIPTVNIVRPLVEAGPAKKGRKPRVSAAHSWKGTRVGARTARPQKP
jgi:hypothetical protein